MQNNNELQKALEKRFEEIISPFQSFIKDSTTSSKLLIFCTLFAIAIANSPLAEVYTGILHSKFGFVFGDHAFSMDLNHWINEALMTFFFLLIGMEIKREVLVGEINNLKTFLPIGLAALGGMIFPALIYYYLNIGTVYESGWGIPMATDTAFAVGILALLGSRIPRSAFVFLTALAIIDDLGAILVIALFYSESISIVSLSAAFIFFSLLLLCNLLGLRNPIIYLVVGILLWISMLGSGVHATIAGILIALTIPARPVKEPVWFLQRTKQ